MSEEPPPQPPTTPEEEPPTAPDPAALDLTGGSPDVAAARPEEGPRAAVRADPGPVDRGGQLRRRDGPGHHRGHRGRRPADRLHRSGRAQRVGQASLLTPGNAIAQAWDSAAGAYVAMFEGSIFNPHTVSAIFQQKSLGDRVQRRHGQPGLQPDLRDGGQRHPADLRRALGGAGVPGRAVQHRRAEPVHRRRASCAPGSASGSACRRSSTSWSACSAPSSAARSLGWLVGAAQGVPPGRTR